MADRPGTRLGSQARRLAGSQSHLAASSLATRQAEATLSQTARCETQESDVTNVGVEMDNSQMGTGCIHLKPCMRSHDTDGQVRQDSSAMLPRRQSVSQPRRRIRRAWICKSQRRRRAGQEQPGRTTDLKTAHPRNHRPKATAQNDFPHMMTQRSWPKTTLRRRAPRGNYPKAIVPNDSNACVRVLNPRSCLAVLAGGFMLGPSRWVLVSRYCGSCRDVPRLDGQPNGPIDRVGALRGRFVSR